MNILLNNRTRSVKDIICVLMLVAVPFMICSLRPVKATERKMGNADYWLLDIVGYNYTNRNIDNFSINGQGGGNVRLSSATSGGGGAVCCVKFWKGQSDQLPMKVRWQFDGCTYLTRSRISGRVFENTHAFYKEADVHVSGIVGSNPRHLEIHFYEDGLIQIQLTEDMSPPLLSLDGARTDKSSFSRCKDDKKPG
jgi:hypothetical protein